MLEQFVIGLQVLWLVVFALQLLPWGARLRRNDHLGLFPAPFFFGFMPRRKLRLEYRSRQAADDFGPWMELSQIPQRKLWHTLLHPWITEPRMLQFLIRNLAKAMHRSGPTSNPGAPSDNFYFRAICHLVRHQCAGAERFVLRLWEGETLLLETVITP